MRYQYRFTKKERTRLADLESILGDRAITPRERLSAFRAIERIEATAQRRAEDREWELPEPTPAPEPTVDDLVRSLEAEKQPLQPVENKGAENDQILLEPLETTTATAKASEVTETAPEPQTAFCGFCHAAGPWNTRWPAEEPAGILLCPTCFGKMCSAEMQQAAAKAKAAAETPPDWAEPFARQRKMYTTDFERSRAIWAEQDRETADRQAQERIEHERAEAQYHRNRADWISNGGRL